MTSLPSLIGNVVGTFAGHVTEQGMEAVVEAIFPAPSPQAASGSKESSIAMLWDRFCKWIEGIYHSLRSRASPEEQKASPEAQKAFLIVNIGTFDPQRTYEKVQEECENLIESGSISGEIKHQLKLKMQTAISLPFTNIASVEEQMALLDLEKARKLYTQHVEHYLLYQVKIMNQARHFQANILRRFSTPQVS